MPFKKNPPPFSDREGKLRSLKITKGFYANRTPYWFVTGTLLPPIGRIRKKFHSRDAAEWFVEETTRREKARTVSMHSVVTSLKSEQVKQAESAFNMLDKDESLLRAVQFYIDNHKRVKDRRLKDVWAEFLSEQKRRGRKVRSIQDYQAIKGFIKQWGMQRIGSLNRKELLEYIVSGNASPNTQNKRRQKLSALFKYAKKLDYVLEDPTKTIDKVEFDSPPPDVLALEEAQKLVDICKTDEHGPLLGFVALCLFGGIRPSETQKLSLSDIHLSESPPVVMVEKGKSKTRRQRSVTIFNNAKALLELHFEKRTELIPKNFKRRYERLRKAASVSWGRDWEQDVLRHTFASCHYAVYKDKAEVTRLCGHTEDVFFRHYMRVVKGSDAQKFFEIT